MHSFARGEGEAAEAVECAVDGVGGPRSSRLLGERQLISRSVSADPVLPAGGDRRGPGADSPIAGVPSSAAAPPPHPPLDGQKRHRDIFDINTDSESDTDSDDVCDAEEREKRRRRQRRRRQAAQPSDKRLPRHVVKLLKRWLMSPEHYDHPYPDEENKARLMEVTGINARQLTTWFTNARKRIWAPRRRRRGEPTPDHMGHGSEGSSGEGGKAAPRPSPPPKKAMPSLSLCLTSTMGVVEDAMDLLSVSSVAVGLDAFPAGLSTPPPAARAGVRDGSGAGMRPPRISVRPGSEDCVLPMPPEPTPRMPADTSSPFTKFLLTCTDPLYQSSDALLQDGCLSEEEGEGEGGAAATVDAMFTAEQHAMIAQTGPREDSDILASDLVDWAQAAQNMPV